MRGMACCHCRCSLRKTRWLPGRERQQILSQLFEGGSLIDVYCASSTKAARGVAINEDAIVGTKWTALTAEIYEEAQKRASLVPEIVRKLLNRSFKADP